MLSYAIGDIHGHLDKLLSAHAFIARDRDEHGVADASIVHVGDLVDRGPDAKGVIDYLMTGLAAGAPWIVLKGNHDRMFTGFMSDPDYHDPGLRSELHWIDPRLGGGTTLASYGVQGAGERLLFDLHDEARALVPASHIAFINALPVSHRHGDALFVHAGIRPGRPLADQTETDLLWIRRDFLDDPRDHGALVVHGHTPVDSVTHYGNRLNIDTGAGYSRDLAVVAVDGRRVWRLTAAGRVPVLPGG